MQAVLHALAHVAPGGEEVVAVAEKFEFRHVEEGYTGCVITSGGGGGGSADAVVGTVRYALAEKGRDNSIAVQWATGVDQSPIHRDDSHDSVVQQGHAVVHHAQIRPIQHQHTCHAQVEEVECDGKYLAFLFIDIVCCVVYCGEDRPVHRSCDAGFQVQIEVLQFGVHFPAFVNDRERGSEDRQRLHAREVVGCAEDARRLGDVVYEAVEGGFGALRPGVFEPGGVGEEGVFMAVEVLEGLEEW